MRRPSLSMRDEVGCQPLQVILQDPRATTAWNPRLHWHQTRPLRNIANAMLITLLARASAIRKHWPYRQ